MKVKSETMNNEKQAFKLFFEGCLELERTVKQLVPTNDTSLVVTTLDHTPSSLEKGYCLIIEKDYIEYTQKLGPIKDTVVLNLKSYEIFVNQKKEGPIYLNTLLDKIQAAMDDVHHQRAKVYETDRLN